MANEELYSFAERHGLTVSVEDTDYFIFRGSSAKVIEQTQRCDRESKGKNRLAQQRPRDTSLIFEGRFLVFEVTTEAQERVDDKVQSAAREYHCDTKEPQYERVLKRTNRLEGLHQLKR